MPVLPKYIENIVTYFKNLTLNSVGTERDLYQLLADKDIPKALSMLQDRDTDVDNAIREYNPQTHAVMYRPNKPRKKDKPYITEKLPRTRQRYINEVELFFLLGKPIVWRKIKGEDEAFDMFKAFLSEQHFDSRMRQAKRLAGAETESAKLYHIYRNERTHTPEVKCVVLARSTGYRLRPLFDQYGNLIAMAYGYILKEGNRNVRHWDFQTADAIYNTKAGKFGWEVDYFPNPTKKINIIYYQQEKAWEGVEPRIGREEMLDSRTADTINYFSDPIAMATADVVDNLLDPDKPGRLIQLTGNNSKFEYVVPPSSLEMRNTEKRDLHDSILFDTFTPDLDFEKMRGMGTLSGAAIRNSLILGYIKRDNRLETYEELTRREANLIIEILKYLHPDKRQMFDDLIVDFQFSEPFADDNRAGWSAIVQLYTNGLISRETAVQLLAYCDAPAEEVQKILGDQQLNMQMQQQQQQQKAEPSPTE